LGVPVDRSDSFQSLTEMVHAVDGE
jgi:hypothetical protein